MKKYLLITGVALLALVACHKAGNQKENVSTEGGNVPAWVSDESLPVPVMFNSGNGVETKSGLILNDDFIDANFRYGVTALDLASPDVNLFKNDGKYAVAKNVNHDNIPAGSKYAQFVTVSGQNEDEVTYYYPLKSTNNFTFFGYRTNEENDFALTWTDDDEAYINNIAIGHQDILWTWYEAPALTPEPGVNVLGYNAKYIRKAWKLVNNNEASFYSTWAPKLAFNHVTTALQFVIKTDPGRLYDPDDDSTLEHKDDAAKKFEDADIYVTSLTVSGLHALANMYVTYKPDTGINDPAYIEYDELLEAAGTVTDIPVQNVVNPTVSRNQQDVVLDHFYPQYNDGHGNDYGEPLLVLPTVVEGTDTPITATLEFHVPNQTPASESIEVTINRPTDGFEAGKKYVITILVHSPEEIEVITSLAPWDTNTDPIGIEIE